MRGRILGVESDGAGVIINADGVRYRFGPGDWRGERRPAPGAAVDFEVAEDGARDVYPALHGLAGAINLDAIRASRTVETVQTLSRGPAAVALAASAAVLAAWVLPALSTPDLSTTLMNIDRIPRLVAQPGALIGEGGRLDGVQPLLWFRFLAPLAAGVVIYRALTRRDLGVAQQAAGGAAVLAGLTPLAIKRAILARAEASGFGDLVSGSLDAFLVVGPGAWLSLIAGLVLLASGLGVLRNPLASRPRD